MSTRSVLAQLRRRRQCIEHAIRALELLQQLKANAIPAASLPVAQDDRLRNVVQFPCTEPAGSQDPLVPAGKVLVFCVPRRRGRAQPWRSQSAPVLDE